MCGLYKNSCGFNAALTKVKSYNDIRINHVPYIYDSFQLFLITSSRVSSFSRLCALSLSAIVISQINTSPLGSSQNFSPRTSLLYNAKLVLNLISLIA